MISAVRECHGNGARERGLSDASFAGKEEISGRRRYEIHIDTFHLAIGFALNDAHLKPRIMSTRPEHSSTHRASARRMTLK